jgi:uncharacterized protein (TIRG00374 family)
VHTDIHSVPEGEDRRPRGGLSLRVGVGLGAGLLLILVFIRLIDVGGAVERVRHLDVPVALLCGVVFLAAYVVRALRWRRLLTPTQLSVARAAQIYFVAIFINWLLPLRGGELAKSLLLRQATGMPVSQSLPTVTMDKVMDLLPALALIGLLPFMQVPLSQPLWLLLVSALVLLAVVVIVVGLAAWHRERTVASVHAMVRAVLPHAARRRAESFVVRFLDSFISLIRRPRLLLVAVGYTAVAVAMDALFCWLAFRAIGTSLALPVVVYGYTLYNLAYLLPTPPGQIGSNELVGLLVFSGLFGVSGTAVGAMFLFSHPWTAILMAAGGLTSLTAMGLGPRGMLTLWRTPLSAPLQDGP